MKINKKEIKDILEMMDGWGLVLTDDDLINERLDELVKIYN